MGQFPSGTNGTSSDIDPSFCDDGGPPEVALELG